MKLKVLLIITLFTMGYPLFSQDNPYRGAFDSFKKVTEEEFSSYRARINKEYSDFIRQSWTWFIGNDAVPIPKGDTLQTPPVVAPMEDRLTRPAPVPIIPEIIIPTPSPEPTPSPITPIDERLQEVGPTIVFDFYGTECKVHVGNCNQLTLENLNENSIADLWDELCKEDLLLNDCLSIKDGLKLCDWAYISFCSSLSDAVYPEQKNEAAILESYILLQSGFDVLFGRDDESQRISGLISANSMLYERPFFNVNSRKYYPLRDIPATELHIFGKSYPKANPFRLDITEEMLFDRAISKQRSFKSEKYPFLHLPFSANENLIRFYNSYPSSQVASDFTTKWRFYANAPASREIMEYLYPTLRRLTSGKTELEAVSMMLDFVQTGFEYEYDEVVWGHDRTFFPDETLYYPYSDCEDRSILFSRIVRDILALDVVLLYSPGHLSAAVHFNTSVNGDYITVDGDNYTICDPTYIYAPVGVAMPGTDTQNLTVIKL